MPLNLFSHTDPGTGSLPAFESSASWPGSFVATADYPGVPPGRALCDH